MHASESIDVDVPGAAPAPAAPICPMVGLAEEPAAADGVIVADAPAAEGCVAGAPAAPGLVIGELELAGIAGAAAPAALAVLGDAVDAVVGVDGVDELGIAAALLPAAPAGGAPEPAAAPVAGASLASELQAAAPRAVVVTASALKLCNASRRETRRSSREPETGGRRVFFMVPRIPRVRRCPTGAARHS